MREPRTILASDDGLEELGDEVIIAQETGAHAPQPRAQVATNQPTVVISEPPPSEERRRMPTVHRRERSEKTVVIRDRKQLDKMRRAISDRANSERHPKPRVEKSTIYLLSAAALASLALGTLIAALVDATTAGGGSAPQAVKLEPSGTAPTTPPSATIEAIDLDALPDPPAKPRRSDSLNQ